MGGVSPSRAAHGGPIAQAVARDRRGERLWRRSGLRPARRRACVRWLTRPCRSGDSPSRPMHGFPQPRRAGSAPAAPVAWTPPQQELDFGYGSTPPSPPTATGPGDLCLCHPRPPSQAPPPPRPPPPTRARPNPTPSPGPAPLHPHRPRGTLDGAQPPPPPPPPPEKHHVLQRVTGLWGESAATRPALAERVGSRVRGRSGPDGGGGV